MTVPVVRRSWVWAVAAVFALLLIILGLAFAPPVQTWAARRWLEAQPDLTGEVGRVSVGLNRVTVKNLDLRTGVGRLQAPEATIQIGLFGALRQQIMVTGLMAHGWQFDPNQVFTAVPAREPTPAGWLFPTWLAQQSSTAGTTFIVNPRQDFAGILDLVRLPVDLSLDGVDLRGEVVLPRPTGAAEAGVARVTVRGGGLRAGETGRFSVSLQAVLSDPTAPVRSLDLQGAIGATLASTRTFEALTVDAKLDARGPQFPDGTMLAARLAARKEGDVENYELAVDTPTRSLASVTASLDPTVQELPGTWRIGMSDTDLAPFALGWSLPEFQAGGEGKFRINARGEAMAVEGKLRVRADRLGALDPHLGSIGALVVDSDFAVEERASGLRITRLEIKVDSVAPVAELMVLQTIEIDRRTGALAVEDSTRDLLRVSLIGLPVAWAQPWWGETVVSGDRISGEWLARAFEDGFVLRGTQPLRASGLAVSQAGRALLENVNFSALVTGVYSARGWQVEIGSLGLRDGSSVLATLELKAGQDVAGKEPIVAVGKYGLNLAAWTSVPALAGNVTLERGELSGDFSARLAEAQELKASVVLRNLRVAGQEPLSDVDGDLRVDIGNDSQIRLDVPLKVSRAGRVSDMALRGTVGTGTAIRLDLALTGDRIFPEDLEVLAAPFAVAGDSGASEPMPPGVPPWAGIEGAISLAFGEVNYGDQLNLRNVSGRIVLADAELRIEGLRSVLGTGGSIGLDAAVKTRSSPDSPGFVLDGQLLGADIAAGPFFRLYAPDRLPTLEGNFEINGKVTAEAPDLAALAEATTGEFSFSSKGGTLRALGFELGQAAQVGSGVVGLVAGLVGGQKAQNIAEVTRAAAAVSTTLSVLTFDQFSGTVTRSANLDFRLSDLALISPTLRVQGAGGITYQPGQAVWRQPLRIELSLAARDDTAENLRRLKLLRDETDTLGYSPIMKPINLEGTLVAISANELKALVMKALTQF